RRRKNARARSASPSALVAKANRQRADRHLAEVAESVAREHGFADLREFVAERTREGASLAAISREAGVHKDWLSRHLRRIDPEAADAAGSGPRVEARWLPVLRELGFSDLAGYLRCRHGEQHWTVNAMAGELGVSRPALEAAMDRRGLVR